VALKTAEGASLAGDILRVARYALSSLERRYPGLKVVDSFFTPDSASFLLDFSRCDEDVSRVVQSYKTEVRKLASREGFQGGHFWQREYSENTLESPQEMEALMAEWNL